MDLLTPTDKGTLQAPNSALTSEPTDREKGKPMPKPGNYHGNMSVVSDVLSSDLQSTMPKMATLAKEGLPDDMTPVLEEEVKSLHRGFNITQQDWEHIQNSCRDTVNQVQNLQQYVQESLKRITPSLKKMDSALQQPQHMATSPMTPQTEPSQ